MKHPNQKLEFKIKSFSLADINRNCCKGLFNISINSTESVFNELTLFSDEEILHNPAKVDQVASEICINSEQEFLDSHGKLY